ncbi:shikimate dehydrogenase family protein [Aquamicrobium defluvii]|uniref:Shikimate dehydrogenase n=1 Tax=Aquamicrobium defluvii TaxID=69279 RepID=A0A011U8N1_9HYPH|nr:shikimate dehydrogenase [Aquamicrobium defluvii]EXL02218.1 shikimate dehydrogenase [Aquamicrobium defluvii]EZQ12981.1 shikimate dehydrogenase [Halopseudomonas bauzanensis]
MPIGGKSTIYFMIADPVDHAKSPGMFNGLFETENIDAIMVPVSFPVFGFETSWSSFEQMKNLRGMIVSVPFKGLAFAHCQHANPRANRVRAANAVIRQSDGSLLCDNFDGAGFVEGMKRNRHVMRGKRALLVGAGGAGASIAFCLAEEKVESLTICDIDGDRASTLARLVAEEFPQCRVTMGAPDPTGHNLVVNATPVGLKPDDPYPLDVDRLTAEMTVVDIIMQPRETRLLQRAKAIGCAIQFGQEMMDCQMELLADFLQVRGKVEVE